MKRKFHGLLLVDKPTGMTSHDVVGRVRRALGQKEVGHAGTLDPLATGLMVLLLGQGTKLSGPLLSGDKGYSTGIRLGVETDTLDVDGEVLSESEVSLDPEIISLQVDLLQGVLSLPVPKYSAVKIRGKKLYEYARNEQEVEVPLRSMEFYDLKVANITKDSLDVEFKCSKGSYVRAWSQELGQRLGVGAVVSQLRRVWSAPYSVEQAISLSELEDKSSLAQAMSPKEFQAQVFGGSFVPLAQALPSWRALMVRGKDERLIFNGQISHNLSRRLLVEQKEAYRRQKSVGIRVISGESGQLLSLLEAEPSKGLKIKRVFRFSEG